MRATLDGLVNRGPLAPDDLLGIYEGKTSSRHAGDWREGLPDRVQLQVQHNMEVAGLDRAWVAALVTVPVFDLRIFEVPRDQALIDVLLEVESGFWQMVVERRPPPVDDSDATREALVDAYRTGPAGQAVELPAEAAERIESWRLASADLAEAEARKSQAESWLMAALADAETGRLDGRTAVTWRRHTRSSIDLDGLRKAHPEVAKQLTRESPYRRLAILEDRK